MEAEAAGPSIPLRDGGSIMRDALSERVRTLEAGIIVFEEVSDGTAAVLSTITEYVMEQAEPFGPFVLITDLSEASLPTASYRHDIVAWMQHLIRDTSCLHIAFMQPGFSVVRVAMRFLISRSGVRERLTVHPSLASALAKARTELSDHRVS